jgi:hypothetical protein
MSAETKFTNVGGLELKSEFSDIPLYNAIRSLQFLFLHTYKFGSDLIIEETGRAGRFMYCIENKGLKLRGYVGRDDKTKTVRYLVMDGGRIAWMAKEGFDLSAENYDRVGVMMNLRSMNDFILFLAGRGGWDSAGYVRTEDFQKNRRKARQKD